MARNLATTLVVLSGCLAGMSAAETPRRTYTNPVDVDYRYNFEQINEQISYRTGADPVIVRHKDAYYLFMTLADGYWRSTNLLDWTFITPSRWPLASVVAPAAISDGERLILMPSMTRPDPVLMSRDPARGQLDFLTRRMPELPDTLSDDSPRDLGEWYPPQSPLERFPPGPWDPALFKDDDGRWYLYWGSSNTFPLYGIEIDMRDADAQQRIRYIGKPRAMLGLKPKLHGWERFGPDHTGEEKPTYIEGAWLTKHAGRYYLQYGAPGTEFNVYATGTYVSDNPLGPFEYAPYNPVGYKPGGFVHGAGHGSTFQDEYGNWWNTGTPWIGHNWNFERRIALFPAAFSSDGQMSVNTRFADFPHYMPEARVTNPEDLFTGWMLLSYRKTATASSALRRVQRGARDGRRSAHVLGGGRERGRANTHRGSRRRENVARRAGQFRRLSIRALSRRAGHLYGIHTRIVAGRQAMAAAGKDRTRTARSAQCVFSAAVGGACALRALRARRTSAPRTWRSAICACSAMPEGLRRARLPASRRCVPNHA